MKKLYLSVFVFLTSLLSSQTDTAGTLPNIGELTLEQLLDIDVYSASRKLERQSEAPAIMTTISHSQIATLGAITLIDVFKYIPGIETSMGADGFYHISIRGANKEGEVLVLINGQQVNDFYDGRALLDLSVDFIERIEVIRGPGSALYGNNAIAGVINIFTIKETSISVLGGNYNTLKLNANYFLEKDKTQFNVSVGGLTTDGANAEIVSDKVEAQSWSLTHADANYKTNRWNRDVYLNSNLKVGDFHFQIFDIARQQGTYIGPVFIAAPGSKLLTNQMSSSLHYDFKISDNVIVTPKIYSNVNYRDFLTQETPNHYVSNTSGNIFENGKYSKESYLGKTYGAEMDIYIKANEHFDLLTGTVFEDLSMSNYSLTRNYKIVGDVYKESFANYDNIEFTQDGKRRYIVAYFLQGNYKIKEFNITAGLRHDDYSDFGSSFNPRIGVNYKVSSHLLFKGLYGKAFRAPTFQELYDNTTIGNEYGVKGNVNLTPEKISTFELGTKITYNKIVLNYNVFYVEHKNLIRIYDPHGGGSIGVYENIGNIKTFGNEAELVVSLLPNKMNFFINYSQYLSTFEWNKEKVKKSDVAFFEKQPDYFKNMTNIPTLRLNAGVELKIKKLSLFAGANYGNEAFNNNRFYLEQDHFADIPFYVQGNFNVGYAFTQKISAKVQLNNVGAKYSAPDESTNINAYGTKGMLQPGTTVMLLLKYKL
ncbi:MAG: TonB-dependent receptor [Bacteroidetes bacterium]|jgi:iron complex outermembrane receptor protein|nr:TonB-dependent receptor [Bacteroidota bacterium]